MSDDVPNGWELREILVFGPGEPEFRPADYPWLIGVRSFVKGGDASPDGVDGEPGYAILELYGRAGA
jgi:hypothetical protein